MKSLYIAGARGLRRILTAVGLLRLLDRWARRSRFGMWVRSLLAIYDFDDLVALGVPWWTFDAAQKVEAHLAERPDSRVFEWGSGSSTMWLADRAAEVTSVEHDSEWADYLEPIVPPQVDLRRVPAVPMAEPVTGSQKPGFEGLDFTDYVRAIDAVDGQFDLIIVDGRAREACFAAALDRLAPDGVLLFDDVSRARYRDAIDAPRRPMEVEWTRGLAPTIPYPVRTALVRLQ